MEGGPAEPWAGEEHPVWRAADRQCLGGFPCRLWLHPPVPLVSLPGLSGGGLSPWGQDGLGTNGRAERGGVPPTTPGPWTVWKGGRPRWPQQVCPGAPASGREAGLAEPLLTGEVGTDPFLPCRGPGPGFSTRVQSLWAQTMPPQDADPPGALGTRGQGCRVFTGSHQDGPPSKFRLQGHGEPRRGFRHP